MESWDVMKKTRQIFEGPKKKAHPNTKRKDKEFITSQELPVIFLLNGIWRVLEWIKSAGFLEFSP